MRFPKHVSITRDMACSFDYVPILPALHPQLLLYPGPPFVAELPVGPFLEFIQAIWWPPGWAVGKHKLTGTVFHNNLTIAKDGHDIGPLEPHVPIPVPPAVAELKFIIHTLKSSRKANFSAGEVKANGDPIACCTMIDWAIIPTPMSYCSVVNIPEAGTGTALLFNSLIVGMHWIDMLAGWLSTIVDMILSVLSDRRGWSEGVSDFLGNNVPDLVSGLVRLAGQYWAGYHGDASLGLKVDAGGGLELGRELERSGEDGRWSGKLLEARYGAAGVELHGSVGIREGGEHEPAVIGEAEGGFAIADGDYTVSADTRRDRDGRFHTETKTDHPNLPEPGLIGGLAGPPTSGDPFVGSNPTSNIPGWDDLPSL